VNPARRDADPSRAPRRRTINALLATASLLVGLATAEVVIRALGSTDWDGNFNICGRGLRPRHLLIEGTRRKIDAYLRSGAATRIAYDPLLGWAPRPNSQSADGLYRYNAHSIRSPVEYTSVPANGIIRIGLFGDSFVHGEEVPFEETFGYFLERQLRAAGFNVEVLNFGVAGYGFDQAFLRWRSAGKAFAPHIVIQGLFMEDAQRDVNLVRAIYEPRTGVPFSKPRFVLAGDRLTLVNVPAVRPERLIALMTSFESWELAPYERFFLPQYRQSFWLRSKALAFLLEVLEPLPQRSLSYALSDEPAQLAVRILEQFKSEVQAEGALFLCVHLPEAGEVRTIMQHDPLVYADLLARIREDINVVMPDQRMAAYAGQFSVEKLFRTSHYSAAGNEIIAATVAAQLQEPLRAMGTLTR
jgi:hypothetical protein